MTKDEAMSSAEAILTDAGLTVTKLNCEALEDANAKIGRQPLEHSEEVNRRGDRIRILEAALAAAETALAQIVETRVEDDAGECRREDCDCTQCVAREALTAVRQARGQG